MKLFYCFLFSVLLIGGCATLNYQKVPGAEQKRYFELAAVSSSKTADEYASIPDSSGRESFWLRFWKEKDPTPTTERNERYEEHLRRVAHADTFFRSLSYFWDDRGRIYIRYGEPDFREFNPMGDALYDTDPFGSTEELHYTINEEQMTVRKQSGGYGWEKWTYGRLNQELSFIQKDVGYHLVKDLNAAKSGSHMSTLGSLQALSVPMPILSDTLDKDIYQHDYGQPLDFSFDLVRFAGKEGAEIWISYGIPLKDIFYDDVSRQAFLNRSIVIFDAGLSEVARDEKILTPTVSEEQVELGQIVDLAKFYLSPGDYNMAISLMDLNSGKTGIYKYKFTVIDYKSGAEEVSDLVLSGDIRYSKEEEKFDRGGYRILPQPGCSFKQGRDIYLFFELYNIQASESGSDTIMLRYLVIPRKGKNVLSSQYEFLTVRNERISKASGIATTGMSPGRYILMVEVKDFKTKRIKNAVKPFTIYK
jgi:GWxTD domain-containing protein